MPKQFLSLVASRTMLQESALLFGNEPGFGGPILVCSHDHRFLAAEQVRGVGIVPSFHILEPVGRNTAPAVAVAAFAAMERNRMAVLLVLPADLLIRNLPAFRNAVARACGLASTGRLVTFGIPPTYAETGYGYIRRGRKLEGHEGGFDIGQFVNKPAAAAAESFLQDGHYLWNSGMFVFKASRYLEELGKFSPAILEATSAAWLKSMRNPDFILLDEEAFANSPSDSIDVAVMEKTGHGAVVESEFGWSDIGSWKALAQASPANSVGNSILGDVQIDGTSNCYVRAESRLTAAVGVENLIIVETPDAVLVTHKDHSQAVSRVVNSLKATQRNEYLVHRRVHCPWGYYEDLNPVESFRITRAMVKPGSEYPFQTPDRAALHLTVVGGTARITIDEEVRLVSENQSTFMPPAAKRRLENIGLLPLEMIEIEAARNEPPSPTGSCN